ATTELFIRATQHNPRAPFNPVTLLDVLGNHVGRTVHGVPIAGRVSDIASIVQQLHAVGSRPEWVLIADCDSSIDIPGLLAAAEAARMTVAYLPSLSELKACLERDAPGIEQLTAEPAL